MSSRVGGVTAPDFDLIRRTDRAWRREPLWSVIEDQATARPQQEALITTDELGKHSRVTYLQLLDNSNRMAQVLAGVGVRPGDGVALWMTNLPEYVYAFFGIQRIGAFVVPVNTFLKSDDVAYVLRKSAVQHLIMLDSFRRTNFVDALKSIVPELQTSTPGHLNSMSLPALRNIVVLRRSSSTAGFDHDLHRLITGPGGSAALVTKFAKDVTPDALGVMLFTSGSTSFPKGVLLEQWGILVDARLQSRRLRLTDRDRWFSMMPFFHNSGVIWGLLNMLTVGGTLVFTEANNPRLGLEMMAAENCTINFGVRSMYRDELDLLAHSRYDLRSLRRAQTFDIALVDEMKTKMGIRSFFIGFGMTETYATVCLGDPLDTAEYQEHGWSYPFEGVELRVVDPKTQQEVLAGSVGEALVRGLVTRGYHELPDQTRNLIDADGWLHTQDLVVRDDAGYVKWMGRIKAMLKVGGENVAAEEVEDILRRADGVLEVCVIGVTDERRGEVPRAYIVPIPGGRLDPSVLAQWCRARLAHFKVPRDYVIVDQLPMTGSGKVDRAAVVRSDPDAKGLGHIQA